jgi:predicted component of type VI protein secretion system
MTDHEFEVLLAPISESSACGPDFHYDAAYDRIRLARQVKSQQFPAGVWEKEEKKVDWPGIAKECVALLQYQSKDLQVVAWLSEALIKTRGMTGLRQGLSVMARLSHKYWEQIHPLPDEGDWSNRLRAFEWLGRELPEWLNTQLRTDTVDAQLQFEVDLIFTSLQDLQQLLDDKLGESVPGINDASDRLKIQLEQWAVTKSSKLDIQATLRSAIGSRTAAYEQIRSIAEFLTQHEPHSPVPEILRAISEWQNFEFGELLSRLPANGPSVYDLARLFTLTKDRT